MGNCVEKSFKLNNVQIDAFEIRMPRANLILAVAPKGFVMCGYLDILIAEKLQDAACVVTGVKSVEELLLKPIVKMTPQAKELGIALGISGKTALEKML
ncbi:MAG: DUF1805 domain-containing protein [Candidatus Omnitrophica bacterium]|nr:DUF1805 domain-containing protein [Candidatus Omnitrophota bacterium]